MPSGNNCEIVRKAKALSCRSSSLQLGSSYTQKTQHTQNVEQLSHRMSANNKLSTLTFPSGTCSDRITFFESYFWRDAISPTCNKVQFAQLCVPTRFVAKLKPPYRPPPPTYPASLCFGCL